MNKLKRLEICNMKNNEWRVSAFDPKTNPKSFKKRKRKRCSASIFDEEIKQCLSINEITSNSRNPRSLKPIPTSSDEVKKYLPRSSEQPRSSKLFPTSPDEEFKKYLQFNKITTNPDNQRDTKTIPISPVLNKRQKLSEEFCSPVIVRNMKNVIKNKKIELAFKKEAQCVRKLIENEKVTNAIDIDLNQEEDICIEETDSNLTTENDKEFSKFPQEKDTGLLSLDILLQKSSMCDYHICSPPIHILEDISQLNSPNTKNCSQISLNIEMADIIDDLTEPPVEKIDFSYHPSPPLVDNDILNISPLKSPRTPVLKSPDHFSQFTNNDIDLNSSIKKSQQDSEKKEVVSSQDNSIFVINSNSTVSDSLEDIKINPFVEICSKKQKKKYKPGTYAHDLQKLLTKQKNDVAIWKHEQYLKSTSNFQPAIQDTTQSIITLTIKNICEAFGTMLIKCSEFPLKNECFVIPTFDFIQDLNLEEGDIIEVYSPYFVKHIKFYDSNSVKIFMNVNKIIKLT